MPFAPNPWTQLHTCPVRKNTLYDFFAGWNCIPECRESDCFSSMDWHTIYINLPFPPAFPGAWAHGRAQGKARGESIIKSDRQDDGFASINILLAASACTPKPFIPNWHQQHYFVQPGLRHGVG